MFKQQPYKYMSTCNLLPGRTTYNSFHPSGMFVITSMTAVFLPYNWLAKLEYWLYEKIKWFKKRADITVVLNNRDASNQSRIPFIFMYNNMEEINCVESAIRSNPGEEIGVEFENTSKRVAYIQVVLHGILLEPKMKGSKL